MVRKLDKNDENTTQKDLNINEIKAVHSYQAEYNPAMPAEEVEKLYNGWKKAVKATLEFK